MGKEPSFASRVWGWKTLLKLWKDLLDKTPTITGQRTRTGWLKERVTEELRHVNLQQFTQQTGTNVTVLLTEPTEAEAPRADVETEEPFQSGSLKWPGSSQQLPRNLCVFCRILSCLVLTLKAYMYNITYLQGRDPGKVPGTLKIPSLILCQCWRMRT